MNDAFHDLARDLVNEIRAAEVNRACDCAGFGYGACHCPNAERLRDLADEMQRRLWVAEIELDRQAKAEVEP